AHARLSVSHRADADRVAATLRGAAGVAAQRRSRAGGGASSARLSGRVVRGVPAVQGSAALEPGASHRVRAPGAQASRADLAGGGPQLRRTQVATDRLSEAETDAYLCF